MLNRAKGLKWYKAFITYLINTIQIDNKGAMYICIFISSRYSIIEAVVHLVNRDFVSLAELYKRMGFIPVEVDTKPIVQALEDALPNVLSAPVFV